MEEKRNSKTHKEIFEEKYDIEKIKDNPIMLGEAMGYLKCLEQFFPSEKWIRANRDLILTIMIIYYL